MHLVPPHFLPFYNPPCLRSNSSALAGAEELSLFFCIKKVCTYLISWTYADKLHTFHCMIYFHNVRQPVHKKTSNKTGFTLVCYSFRSYYIFLFKKCQTKISCIFSFIHYNRHEIKKSNCGNIIIVRCINYLTLHPFCNQFHPGNLKSSFRSDML